MVRWAVIRRIPPQLPSSTRSQRSTITSPAFFRIIVVFWDYDFCGVESPRESRITTGGPFRAAPQTQGAEEASRHNKRFEMFREVHKTRGFQLVLCADVWDRIGRYSMRMLREAVAAEMAKGGFDDVFSEPLVVYSPRESRYDPLESIDTTGYHRSITWTPL